MQRTVAFSHTTNLPTQSQSNWPFRYSYTHTSPHLTPMATYEGEKKVSERESEKESPICKCVSDNLICGLSNFFFFAGYASWPKEVRRVEKKV